jgi:hypothetical protein
MHAVAMQFCLGCLLTIVAAILHARRHFAGACGMRTVALLGALFHKVLFPAKILEL